MTTGGYDDRPEVMDVRGLGCGSVLVRLAQKRKVISESTTILLWTDDAGADEELPAWCRMTLQQFGGRLDKVDDVWRYELTLTPLLAKQQE